MERCSTNLSSLYRLSKACPAGMTKARWGRIVTITSVVGSMGNAGQSNYAATKAGAEGFSRALAGSLVRGDHRERVAPGFIDTDMTRELPSDSAMRCSARFPWGGWGSRTRSPRPSASWPVTVAYITGETIHVNGGMYMA